jgi:lipid II:glycine glycyltransferase (peptidoglycan interpeptide bridge formation enzyme)
LQIKLIQSDFDRELFNSRAINPIQTWEWGETKIKLGKKVFRFGSFEENELVEVYTVILNKLPKVNFYVGHLIFSLIPNGEVVSFIKESLKDENVIFLKIEPYAYENSKFSSGDITGTKIQNSKEEWEKSLESFELKFSKPESRYFYNETILLDLTKSEEQLSIDLRKSTRYTIRQAEKKGVLTEESSDFNRFWNLFELTAKRQNYHGHDLSYHKIVWEIMKDKFAEIFIARIDNQDLAAFELFFFKNTAYYVYSGSSDQNRNLGGSNLLMWNCILEAKKRGLTKFDLWGVGDKASFVGFTAFKEGYGGERVYMIEGVDVVFKPLVYSLFKILNSLRLNFNKVKKAF